MPLFEFDLETFTVVRLNADSEPAARQALGAVLDGLARTEYAIGEARVVGSDRKSRGRVGRPADARRLLPRILELRSSGMSMKAIGEAVGVCRSSVHRALKWAAERGG